MDTPSHVGMSAHRHFANIAACGQANQPVAAAHVHVKAAIYREIDND
jgi:hypothetical protein